MNTWLKEYECVAVWIGAILGFIATIPTVIGWYRGNPVLRLRWLRVLTGLGAGFELYLSLNGEFSRGVSIFGSLAFTIICAITGIELKREQERRNKVRETKEKRQRQKWKDW